MILKKQLAIIPARRNSKGIPRKNVRHLSGRPLIEYTFAAAAKAKTIDDIIVSTDDEAVTELATKWGFHVHHRPEYLASDTALMTDVVLDILSSSSISNQYAVLLQPTSPMRTAQDIDIAFEGMLKKSCHSAISVKKIDSTYCKILASDEAGNLEHITQSPYCFMPRQELPTLYQPNGALFHFDIQIFKRGKSFFLEPCHAYSMDDQSSVDLDTENDFKQLEYLLNE